jgi:hypothetical protein
MTTKVPNYMLEAFEPAACFRTSHSLEQTAGRCASGGLQSDA